MMNLLLTIANTIAICARYTEMGFLWWLERRKSDVPSANERKGKGRGPQSTVPYMAVHAPTNDFAVAQAPGDTSLAPALSADDISDEEMAPPRRVTHPFPLNPPAPMSGDLANVPARAPPPPIVPKRISLPPPARSIPAPSPFQSSSPHRTRIARRVSRAPPPRETPSPALGSLDIALLQPQASTKRNSLPPPTCPAPRLTGSITGSPSPRSQLPKQDSLESGQNKEAPRIQDGTFSSASPPLVPTPTHKPSIAPSV